MSTPTHLIGAERRVYVAGADKSRKAYRTKHGAGHLRTIGERRDWQALHATGLAIAAERGGMSAVRKMHAARVAILETMSDPTRVGGPATGDHLAILTRDAEHAAERLAILAPAKSRKPAARKTPARKLASVPDVVETVAAIVEPVETPAPIVAACVGKACEWQDGCADDWCPNRPENKPVTPEGVPADVQTYPQIRAARKASRRELAATMRAAGLVPNGVAWQLARSGVDLADIPAILAGDAAMPESVTS